MAIDVTEVKRRLLALLGNDANMVMAYIRQYGPTIDIKSIKELKERNAQARRTTESGEGEDPIFEIKVRCPVCNQDEISCYELRAKSQQILQNKFLVPVYRGAMGYRTLDYTLLSVTVCPRCLMASPDKKDFIRGAGTPAETKTQLTSHTIMGLQEKIGERRALMKNVPDYESYFRRPRFDDAAIMSYRLSMMRASVEAWFELPYSIYKLGAYALRISKIIHDAGGDNREILIEALASFEDSFRTSDSPAEEIELQVIYTIIALCLKLGDPKKANSYIGVYNNLRNTRKQDMQNDPALTTALIDRWEERAKRLWEDREEPELFKDE